MIKGSYALITGATRGIGRSIAYALAAEGCHLMLAARTEGPLLTLKEELQSLFQIEVQYAAVDCSKDEQVKQLAIVAMEVYPQIDILVNNVGMFVPGGLLEEEEEALAAHWAVNVHCTHYLSVFFGRKMCTKRSGYVFNIGSIAGTRPFAKAAAYSVTKYAVHGLTAILRQEFGPYGVKVTEIIPGSTYTSSWEGVDIPEEKFVAASDIAKVMINCLQLSAGANVDEMVIRPLDEGV